VKVITFLLRRRPELTADEFHRYWREEHAPLVAGHAAALGIRKYVQLHAADSPLGRAVAQGRDCEPADYDGIALVWFDGEDALVSTASTPAGVAGSEALLRDERRFLDLARCQLWFSDEHVVLDAPS
jgi:hypothetical protein